MYLFTIRRLNLFLFTMLVLTVLSFSMSFLFPGNQLINLSGHVYASSDQLAQLSQLYASEESIFAQYWAYLKLLFSGEMGISMSSQLPILDEITSHLPATIELSLVALFIAMLLGIPIGFIAAINHRKPFDNITLSISMIGYSIPVFWLGLLAILIFSIQLAWLPSAGRLSLLYEIEHQTGFLLIDILMSENQYKWQALSDAFAHIILPATVIALAPATIFMRLARTAMMEVLETHYIKAAKAKGLTFGQIIYHHAIRNAMVKVIRDVGLQFANIVTITMITEMIFNWPGIGRWLIESVYLRDYTAIKGGLLALSSFIFIVHIVIDFIYAALNPIARDTRHGTR